MHVKLCHKVFNCCHVESGMSHEAELASACAWQKSLSFMEGSKCNRSMAWIVQVLVGSA